MAASRLSITKTYADGSALSESDLDNIKNDTESWASDTVNNLDQLRLDLFGSSYTYDNDGSANNGNPINVQQTITPTATITGLTVSGGSLTTGAGVAVGSLDSLTTGSGITIASNSSDTGSRNLFSILNDNVSATGAKLALLDQDSNQICIDIDTEQTTTDVINISPATLTTGIVIDIPDADALTTGSILNLVSDSASTSTRNLLNLVSDNSAASGTTLANLQQDGDQVCLAIDKNGTGAGTCVTIDNEGTGSAFVANNAGASTNCIINTAENASYAGDMLLLDAVRTANSAYRAISFRSDTGSSPDTEFKVDGTGQIFSDAGTTITQPADYVCHDCGHSTLEFHKTCPECHSLEFKWNDDVEQFMGLAQNNQESIDLAEKMGLLEKKSAVSKRYNMNVNRMIGFMGFAMNQLKTRIEQLESK